MIRATLTALVAGLCLVIAACSDDVTLTPDAAPVPDAAIEVDASPNPCFLKPDGTFCGDQTDSECDHPDMCVSGYCYANFEIAGKSCGNHDSTECDRADTCNGSGVCSANPVLAGTVCGDPPPGPCHLWSTCNGDGTCLPNYVAEGTICGTPTEDCREPDTCDSAGTCLVNYSAAGTPCGDASDGDCTHPDTCDSAGACLQNHEPLGAACGDQGDSTCTNPDSCDGVGACTGNDEENGFACDDCAAGSGLCDICLNGACADYCRVRDVPTTMNADNGSDGAMFNIRAQSSIQINSFDTNLDSGTYTVDIHYRAGGYEGAETNAAAWTLIGSVDVVSSGPNVPTPIPLAVNVLIPEGQTYGFYVTTRTGTMNYTIGTTEGAVYAADGNLEILEGVGKLYPFGATSRVRVWNGVVHYELSPCQPIVPEPDAGVPDADVPDAAVPDADVDAAPVDAAPVDAAPIDAAP